MNHLILTPTTADICRTADAKSLAVWQQLWRCIHDAKDQMEGESRRLSVHNVIRLLWPDLKNSGLTREAFVVDVCARVRIGGYCDIAQSPETNYLLRELIVAIVMTYHRLEEHYFTALRAATTAYRLAFPQAPTLVLRSRRERWLADTNKAA